MTGLRQHGHALSIADKRTRGPPSAASIAPPRLRSARCRAADARSVRGRSKSLGQKIASRVEAVRRSSALPAGRPDGRRSTALREPIDHRLDRASSMPGAAGWTQGKVVFQERIRRPFTSRQNSPDDKRASPATFDPAPRRDCRRHRQKRPISFDRCLCAARPDLSPSDARDPVLAMRMDDRKFG